MDAYADPDHEPYCFDAGQTGALLLHGFMGSPKEMRPLGRALADAGVTARGILLPGFAGDIANLRRVRAADWVDAARAAWHEVRQRHERTLLVGFSMGGAVALQVAAEDEPDALVLLAPHWRFADRRAMALPLLKHVMRDFRPFGNADFANPEVRQTLRETFGDLDLDDPATQRRLRDQTAVPTRTLDELRQVSGGAGRAARRVTSPALIIQGRDDRTVLPGDTRRLAARLGGPVDVHDVDAGHLLVNPEAPAWASIRDRVVEFATGSAT
jgi:carboxylesterase